MSDPHRIPDAEALREILPGPSPVTALKIFDHLDETAIGFIARSPFLVMSTSDAAGRLDASPKGDAPGFVRVEDPHTLVFPERRGNQLAMGLQNVLANPRVGLLFLVPGTSETLRVNGRAELTRDPELLASLTDERGKPALLAMRIHTEEVFFHCAKAFVRSALWKPDRWGERYRVSFGSILKERLGVDEDGVKAIDAAIDENTRTQL
ncbi:MAG: pyridoxamine 5'-phosphate oxidase family protein [Myxococcota bacterium]|nr:pyridoxamine 5'-phosphate oxidase family protein [Myxococcota bacterium]